MDGIKLDSFPDSPPERARAIQSLHMSIRGFKWFGSAPPSHDIDIFLFSGSSVRVAVPFIVTMDGCLPSAAAEKQPVAAVSSDPTHPLVSTEEDECLRRVHSHPALNQQCQDETATTSMAKKVSCMGVDQRSVSQVCWLHNVGNIAECVGGGLHGLTGYCRLAGSTATLQDGA